jgi:chromate transporter
MAMPVPSRLGEVARVFLWLGTIGFGGPVAHIALMEQEIVRRRRWIEGEEFVDLIGLTNLIPGPNSTEMAMALGFRRAGWPGLVVGGASFILPAAVITCTLAWLYGRYGAMPEIAPWLWALGPAVVGLMAGAIFRLARPALTRPFQIGIAVVIVALGFGGVDEVVLLLGGGAAGALTLRTRRTAIALLVAAIWPCGIMAAQQIAPSVSQPALSSITLFFLKTGAVLYGGGYVLIALLQPLVDSYGWLSQTQLVDAIAAGQVTPGPVLTTATFVGYLLHGVSGAAVATGAIFLPAFLFVTALGPLAPRLRRWAPARGFLDGVNAAAIALMLVVTVTMGRSLLTSDLAIVLAVLSTTAALAGVNGGWIVLIGLAAGKLIHLAASYF